jgi:hypothetical protein
MMAQRHEAAAVVIASEVQHDGSEICGGPIDRVDPAGMSRQTQERFLHDVLGGITIVDEESCQSDERATLGTKESKDEVLCVGADGLALQSRGHGHPQHRQRLRRA